MSRRKHPTFPKNISSVLSDLCICLPKTLVFMLDDILYRCYSTTIRSQFPPPNILFMLLGAAGLFVSTQQIQRWMPRSEPEQGRLMVGNDGAKLPSFFDGPPSSGFSIASRRSPRSCSDRTASGGWSTLERIAARFGLFGSVLAAEDCIGNYLRCANSSEYSCTGCPSQCFAISDPEHAPCHNGYDKTSGGGCCDYVICSSAGGCS